MGEKMRRKKKIKLNTWQGILSLIIIIIIAIFGYISSETENASNVNSDNITNIVDNSIKTSFDLTSIPEYSGEAYVIINNNKPQFTQEDYSKGEFEIYSELDSLGRCGVAFANISKKTMPSENDERGDISSVTPSGWKQKKYDTGYLYHRCHLIGYQLSNENANEKNLITGTEYLNIEGMLPFENKIAEYIDLNPNNHVLYRVTPIFSGNNLIASGVQLEAYSIEDNGEGVSFNVYCYNVQPGITINYQTGESLERSQ